MKTSISVPDELWDCVKDAGDGPSAVVQQALTLLCERKSDPMAHAPSDDLKDRLRAAVSAEVERVAGAARKMSEDGYELGVALASHLGLVELLALPDDVDRLQELFAHVWNQDYINTTSSIESFDEWSEDHGLSWNDLLYTAPEFWQHFDLALERHVESAASGTWDGPDGETGLTFGVLSSGPWASHPVPDGWWVPEPDPSVGNSLAFERGVPAAYLRGIAGALVDIRSAAAAYSGGEPAAPAADDVATSEPEVEQ